MSLIEQETYQLKNGLNVIIRNAHPKDAVQIIDVNLKIVNEKLYMLRTPGETFYTPKAEKEKIAQYELSDGSLYIVAETEGKVVGYLDFENGGFKRTKHSGSFSVYIIKEFRRMGIGEILINTLIEWAQSTDLIEKITLAVFSTNENAQKLYRKLGFKEEGRCPKDMKLEDDTYIDSVLMYRFVEKSDKTV
ncbi:MAG: GNAT family N-acetyltransferase [Ignavibacteriae bacterium]|nr:GNAT family N-acetyltransferase [Ignavibacteriota bacterium]